MAFLFIFLFYQEYRENSFSVVDHRETLNNQHKKQTTSTPLTPKVDKKEEKVKSDSKTGNYSTGGHHNNPPPAPPPPEINFEESFFPQKLPLGEKEYLVANDIKAVPITNYQENFGKKLFAHNGYVFFESQKMEFENIFLANKESHPVVYNKANKAFGVVSGIIKLKLSSSETAQNIQREYDLNMTYAAEHIQRYYFRANNPSTNLLNLVNTLKKRPDVLEANLEIIEGRNLPQ